MRVFLDVSALLGLLACALGLFAEATRAQPDSRVAVFVLAGQSNMEGKAKNTLFDLQAEAEPTKALFAHLRSGGKWVERDDVFLKFLGRKGKLTLGYGSPGRTGLELEFGTVVGDRLVEPVLLVKTAWGGHSLFRQFRPPSAAMPGDAELASELAAARERITEGNEKRKARNQRPEPLPELADIAAVYGSSYRAMIAEVRAVLAGHDKLFPELRGTKPELAGFVWFQGWNDQYGGAERAYETNLRHLIRDLRRDLAAPQLPFVIGVMGQNGSKPTKGAMKVIQDAQLAMNDVEELRGNVRAVRTDLLVDQAAEALYPTWRDDVARWERTGSDHAYHYLGSAIWFTRIGRALGEAMLELLPPR